MNAEMSYHVCDLADLPAVLDDLLQGEEFDAWLEDPLLEVDSHGLRLRDHIARAEALGLPATWPEGRLFHPAVDIRWERRPGKQLHLVAIADSLPALFRMPEPLTLIPVVRSHANGNPEQIILWGERTNDPDEPWREGRIPNLSRFYPAWKGRWAAIESRTYEAAWIYDAEMPPAVRIVTRYLRYIGDYKAPFDQRFKQDKEQ